METTILSALRDHIFEKILKYLGLGFRVLALVGKVNLKLEVVGSVVSQVVVPFSRDNAYPDCFENEGCGRTPCRGARYKTTEQHFRWTPHPEIVTIRHNRDYTRVLLYSYYTTITGWRGPPKQH